MDRRIIIGNDHGGFAAKRELAGHLGAQGWEITDIGCHSEEIVRYPLYARAVAGAVARGEYPRGILLCSTGIGMAIAANKIKGIRAALCTSHYMAKMTRQHNDANVLCLGGRITGIFELIDIAETWLAREFIGGRHTSSLDILAGQEAEYGLTIPCDHGVELAGNGDT